MKALLLAAGLGTRLRPLTNNIPKCLVPVKGRPLLDYWLQMLTENGCRGLLVNTHYFADKVEAYIRTSGYQDEVKIVYEEKLLGTAGTVLKNRDFFASGPFMLIHADNLSKFNVRAFIERHQSRPKDCEITMMTYITPTPQTCGIVQLDKRGVVVGFHEKKENPPGNLASGAVYILEPSIIDFLAGLNKEVIDFSTEVLPHYMGKIFTFHNEVYHRDIGTMDSYQLAQKEFDRIQALSSNH